MKELKKYRDWLQRQVDESEKFIESELKKGYKINLIAVGESEAFKYALAVINDRITELEIKKLESNFK